MRKAILVVAFLIVIAAWLGGFADGGDHLLGILPNPVRDYVNPK